MASHEICVLFVRVCAALCAGIFYISFQGVFRVFFFFVGVGLFLLFLVLLTLLIRVRFVFSVCFYFILWSLFSLVSVCFFCAVFVR